MGKGFIVTFPHETSTAKLTKKKLCFLYCSRFAGILPYQTNFVYVLWCLHDELRQRSLLEIDLVLGFRLVV